MLDKSPGLLSHVEELCQKLSKPLGVLKHKSTYLQREQRETYYNGVIKSTLMYGSMV